MNLQEFLFPIGMMLGLGLALSAVLSLAHAKLKVYEDPKIEAVDLLLPQANCGACGSPGCRAFAERLVSEGSQPALCTVSTQTRLEEIAELLGVEAGSIEKRVARLACQGGSNVAKQRATYHGPQNCHAANLVGGGAKGCAWGCLGYGDCERVCAFGAIEMDEHNLPQVNEEKCTSCGDCVEVCPKFLFSLEIQKNHLFVACKNLFYQEEAEMECLVACTGCGLCAADSPAGLVTISENLATVNRDFISQENQNIIQRCPTGAILWVEEGNKQKGKQARKIIQQSTLEVG